LDQSLRSPGKRYKVPHDASDLKEAAKNCELYKLMYSTIQQYNCLHSKEITISLVALDMDGGSREAHPMTFPSLYTDLGMCFSSFVV
jgi:hypothetical protein